MSDSREYLLVQLYQHICRIKTELAQLPEEKAHHPIQRFDTQLFQPILKSSLEYFDEIERNYTLLKQSVYNDHAEQTAFLAERLCDQINALQRELATLPLRNQDKSAPPAEDLYQKLSQYQDYQRRLKNMLRDKEAALQQCSHFSQQQTLQQAIATLTNRYSRCLNAIKTVERQIEQREKL